MFRAKNHPNSDTFYVRVACAACDIKKQPQKRTEHDGT